mmetsp:Transcript_50614/g.61045  ORF Transcript_50614/g.61045 Transcript_50614/m.61045 type:complete len:1310 (+) Transcript_50614:177-4106(+)|eukprot:CAMPEP_0172497002 /NCGR_PEP_ID=MMETSP1066-20121228/94737_1 /TAXON_ID=671091 /ORGANISM="Coscinodiscus wailesii, Strain CCMP2513" /LENGTH=1309 /DNA_ID=CAMNT_0013269573 /DNA_START=164 /DNA_END=4093 /DNA_ORIENTATION=+
MATNTTGMADGSSGTFDLELKLHQRLRETNDERMRTQAKINALSDQLQRMFSKTPKKPRDTLTQMDDKIAKLEYDRTTHSLTLPAEKQILRQIDLIKRSKKTLKEYEIHEHAIQEKKNDISELRDNMRTINAAMAEIESALHKVKLAKRLGCTTSELKTCVVDCPADKIGHIIGKNGTSLKLLEERTGVQVDVDKVGSKIHLQGSAAALEAAVKEVENITLAVEEQITLQSAVVDYLLSQRSAVLKKLEVANPEVQFDLSRNSTILHLRGRPEFAVLAKKEVENLDVKTLSRNLSSKETGLVVGKGGATINKLISDHDVSINVLNESKGSDAGATVEITGPSANADAALAEVEEILYENEESEDFVLVETMQRNMFLSNGGAVLKEIQAEINEGGKGGILLLFERRGKDERNNPNSKDPSKLSIKTSRANMARAMELVRNRIEAHEKTVLTIKVDADKVAAIIGKGGATINQLRQEGSGAEIEVDKDTGVIKIQSEDDDVKAKVKHAIDEIVLANQILNVEVEKSMISLLFGETGKPLRKKISDEMNVWIGVDSSYFHVTLRGTQEKIEEAAVMLKEFIAENYTSEFEIELDDEPVLFHGGSDNIMVKLENIHDVFMKFIKASHSVVIRGVKENVDAALKELEQFMIGGDGFQVVKLKVPDFSVGVIIGKGGSNIAKLEKDYEGVVVDLLRTSGMLSIRGPENAVRGCRSSVITTLATIRVTDTIVISPEQRVGLARPEVMKKITDGLGAQITLSDHSVKIRGIPIDVKDAKALVLEQLNGIFEATIDLEASQLSKVSKAVKDFSHFQRIKEMSKADLTLDTLTSAIVISGKRGNVKKAKNQLFGFLDFLLPSEFAKVKVTRALLRKVGEPVSLAKISADTGAFVTIDRELGCIQARSIRPDEVKLAVEQINERIIECEKLNYILRLDSNDSWLLPKIIGKGGATVQALQSDTGCAVDIYKDEFIVAVSGEDEEAVAAAKLSLDNIIEKARRECVFIDIPDSAMSAFIGKAGSNIKKLSETNGVEIERLRKDPSRIRIQGDEVSVQTGKIAIMQWVKQWESKNIGISLSVDKNLIPVILGKQGSNVNAIQQETGCRIDIDRRSSTITVRGESEASKDDAMARIKQTIQDEKDKEETKRLEKEARQRAQAEEEAAKKAAKAVAICANTQNNAKTVESEVSRNKQNQDDGFKPIDRSSEFAVKPVGLSSNGNSQLNKVLANGKRNKKKVGDGSKEKVIASVKEQNKPQGTAAANNLFQMLVSDTQPTQSKRDEHESLGSESPSSSTDDISTEPVTQPKTFYKSASGFSIRL